MPEAVVIPSGPESLALSALRNLLANSATFQTWVGAANATAAKARIHNIGLRRPAGVTRPYAVVSFDGGGGGIAGQMIARAAGNAYSVEGRLFLAFTANPIDPPDADGEDFGEVFLEFTNKTGAILLEMKALAGSGGYLDVTGFDRVAGPHLSREEDSADMPDAMFSEYAITYLDAWG